MSTESKLNEEVFQGFPISTTILGYKNVLINRWLSIGSPSFVKTCDSLGFQKEVNIFFLKFPISKNILALSANGLD